MVVVVEAGGVVVVGQQLNGVVVVVGLFIPDQSRSREYKTVFQKLFGKRYDHVPSI